MARLEPLAPAAAEVVIARLLGGELTANLAAHDIVCVGEKKFEVKVSQLNSVSKTSKSRRWQWGHALGNGGAKHYHQLILVGKRDPRYSDLYLEPKSKSPYVLFDIPFRSVKSVMRKDDLIQITTNPNAVTADAAKLLFQTYQVTRSELRKRYNPAYMD